jgi:hypothetical protein
MQKMTFFDPHAYALSISVNVVNNIKKQIQIYCQIRATDI